MKQLCLGLVAVALVGSTLVWPALADTIEHPAYVPYPFHRAHKTRRVVRIIPYLEPFGVRVFTTPQKPPYYNVPPYPVISAF